MDIANYADENTLYATANDIDSLTVSLEEDSKSLFTYFDNNPMKSNADKCHLSAIFNGKVKIKIVRKLLILNVRSFYVYFLIANCH